MNIWAIADLHLSFSRPDKDMAVFGPLWEGYAQKIEKQWREHIADEDLVLIAGDISWAMKTEEAITDLEWIDHLPGTKVIIRGNHDYWWSSLNKVKSILPPSIHALQHSPFNWQGVSISGTRLWDSDEYGFSSVIEFKENPREKKIEHENQKIFEREIGRLELAAQTLDPSAKVKIMMTHYPPIGLDLEPSRASQVLEKYGVNICLFGHLHSIDPTLSLFGEARGINYLLTSADYLNFTPVKVLVV